MATKKPKPDPTKNHTPKRPTRKKRTGADFALVLKGTPLLKLRCALAEYEVAQAKYSECDAQLSRLLSRPEHSEVAALIAKKAAMLLEVRDVTKEYGETQLEIFGNLGILPEHMHRYSVDTRTGAVFESEPKAKGLRNGTS